MKTLILSALLVAAFSSPAVAVPIVIHNTGEGLSVGQLDANWTVETPGGSTGQAVSAVDPNGAWVTPAPGNTWVGIAGSASIPTGVYEYSTTFTLAANSDLSTAVLSGFWWVDDLQALNGIYLNGVLVSGFDGAQYNDPNSANAAFTINSGFVLGTNTLTFAVNNTGGPGGTLVQGLNGSVSVPDGGSSALLFALSLAGLAVLRMKRIALS
jgi:VPDSG-CTERM motif